MIIVLIIPLLFFFFFGGRIPGKVLGLLHHRKKAIVSKDELYLLRPYVMVPAPEMRKTLLIWTLNMDATTLKCTKQPLKEINVQN